MTNKELIMEVKGRNYNEFVLTNNVNDEVVKGKILRGYNGDNTGFAKNELILELDVIHRIYLPEYAHRIGCRLNKIPTLCTGVEQSGENEFKIMYNKVVFTLKCAYNPSKLVYSKAKNLEPPFELRINNTPLFEDLLHEECIDNLYSNCEDNIVTLVMDCYVLGSIKGWMLGKWREIYSELLNGAVGICDDDYNIYNKSSTPYLQYDYNNDKCYIGIYSYDEGILSKFESKIFKGKTSDINPTENFEFEVKTLCDTYRHYINNSMDITFQIGDLEINAKFTNK